MRKKLRLVYLLVIAFVLVIIATGLLYAGTHIKKYEAEPENKSLKVFGIALYLCCFPIKTWVIFVTIYEMLFGNNHWAFG